MYWLAVSWIVTGFQAGLLFLILPPTFPYYLILEPFYSYFIYIHVHVCKMFEPVFCNRAIHDIVCTTFKKRFSWNFAQMLSSLRWCAKALSQPFWPEVKVTLEGWMWMFLFYVRTIFPTLCKGLSWNLVLNIRSIILHQG